MAAGQTVAAQATRVTARAGSTDALAERIKQTLDADWLPRIYRERTTVWTPPRVPASIVVALLLTVAGVLFLGLFPGRVLNAFRETQTVVVTTAVKPVPSDK